MPTNLFISAGEASGEHYGALLVAALQQRLQRNQSSCTQKQPCQVAFSLRKSHLEHSQQGHVYSGFALKTSAQTASFFGMGGERMKAAGLECVVRSEEMAVMGLTEVIVHLPRIWREYRKLKQAIRQRPPSVAVLIDFPEIHFRLARELHRLGVPVIFFVSPQLWAWKKKRIRLVQKYINKMLVIFPFEEAFYRERGVEAEFVGHPLAELPLPAISREEFAAQHDLDPAKTWIGLLPGSRAKEIRDHLPTILQAARKLAGLPVGSAMVETYEVAESDEPVEPDALKGHGFSRAANSPKTDAALAAEGICPAENGFPQGLKPRSSLGNSSARLKPCPFKTDGSPNDRTAGPSTSLRSAQDDKHIFEFIVPFAPTLNEAQRDEVRRIVAEFGSGLTLRLVEDARAALLHARASVVASGTATVEAALIGNPFVVVYRVSALTFAIAKRVVKVPFVAMANLIAGKQIVPELIQSDFTAEKIVQEIERLLPDGPQRQSMMEELARVRGLLSPVFLVPKAGTGAPALVGAIDRVAAVTLEMIREGNAK